MKRRSWTTAAVILSVVLIGAAIALVFAARRMAGQTIAIAPAAAAETPTEGAPGFLPLRTRRTDFVGVLTPPLTVNLSSRVEGKLASVDAQLGLIVRAGETLASLDTRLQEHDVAMARASYRAARAASAAARVEVSRARDHLTRREKSSITVGNEMLSLVSGEETAQAAFDKDGATAKFLSSSASALQEQKRVEHVSTLLEEHSLRAPFDCVVAARFLDPGTYVKPGDPVVRIVAIGAMSARFAVPEDQIRGVHLGDAVRIDMQGRASTLPRSASAVDVGEVADDKSIAGRVERISPEVEPSSRLVVVEAKAEGDGSICQDDCAGLAGRVVRVSLRQ